MTELLRESPDLVRLLKSGMSALPLREDFWGTLTYGLGCGLDELGVALRLLYESGIVHGMGGEANPVRPGMTERLDWRDGDPGQRPEVRWRGRTESGRWIVSSLEGPGVPVAGEAIQWLKVGYLPDLSFPDSEGLLEPGGERTLLPGQLGDAAEALPEPSGTGAIEREMLIPRRPLPPEPVWRSLTEDANNLDADRVRQSIGFLLMVRRWRRFAFRLNLTAMGWRGCAVAGWAIEDGEAPRAAGALARARGTGDVAVRQPVEPGAASVTALLIGREPGAGLAAARCVEEQWGRRAVFAEAIALS